MNISEIMPLWPLTTKVDFNAEEGNVPSLQVFYPEPDRSTGAAMVIFPGGGYEGLAPHEGGAFAEWLAGYGMTGIVVKYRLGSKGHRHPAMLNDAKRALRLARANAAAWGIDPQRIGVMGSSAGGHLTASLLTQFDLGHPQADDEVERQSSRPDLGVLCYPVISMGDITHEGSRRNLLGETPSAELVSRMSNEKRVTPDTPPCFVWHTYEDETVKVENPLAFAQALRANGVKFELHIYERGGHGMGLGAPHRWTADCLAWLQERGFARRVIS
ncbi:MAG: alpha/beta hydrolase [Verrucomicrobiales bacterium]|jgi:acetyl esterase/lipase|nr:alpha/beta hydrolase [Verrucomicrobiales bacterium]